jgi:hypothetical protein
MTLVIGTDEAGYGPNLGPLVVAATAWRVAAPADEVERAVATALDAIGPLWADSKTIYRGGAGFAALETGALVGAAAVAGAVPHDWPALAATLGPALGTPLGGPVENGAAAAPGVAGLEALALPQEADGSATAARADEVRQRLAAHGVALVAVRCRLVQPAEFNRLLDEGLNKADILSRITLSLAAGLVTDGDAVRIWCDRHGGRKRYAGVVSAQFDGALVQPVEETAARSAYLLSGRDCRIEFCVGGESRAPVALASMTAKYVRELAMRVFNDHWCGLLPGLAPTAGYPVDAARWRTAAAPAVTAAGAGWDAIWRRA